MGPQSALCEDVCRHRSPFYFRCDCGGLEAVKISRSQLSSWQYTWPSFSVVACRWEQRNLSNKSWLTYGLIGHFSKFFHRHEGWKIHTELLDKYAAVSRISGPFGVCPLFLYDNVSPDSWHKITDSFALCFRSESTTEHHYQRSTVLWGSCIHYFVRCTVKAILNLAYRSLGSTSLSWAQDSCQPFVRYIYICILIFRW